jgi:dipeptidyl aminopeptidase/acylaminoacyl peptidase
MKLKIFLFGLITFLVGWGANAKEVRQYTVEQFLNTTTYSGGSFSEDEKSILVSNNRTGIFNVYRISVVEGKEQELTHSEKENFQALSYFPKDDRILYTHDQGGNENNHIYMLANGVEKDLTPGKNLKAIYYHWTGDENGFYFATNERDPKYFDLYVMDTSDFQRKMIYRNDQGYDIGAISKDGKHVALLETHTDHNTDLHLYDTSTKKTKHITPHKGDILYVPEEFDPASQNLYFLSDEGSEFSYVVRYELSTGKMETAEKAKWDIEFTDFSRNGRYRISAVNEDGRTVLHLYDQTTGREIPLPTFPNAEITNVKFSPSEKFMAFYVNGDRAPNDLYLYNFATRDVKKLTNSLSPDINSEDLVDSEIVRYKSFDQMEIPSLLMKPHQADSAHKVPALVYVHGGPGGQTRIGYSAMRQFLVNHGYVVFGVNNRGSSGYGKTFYKADDLKHGYEPLWDCVDAKKYLAALPYVDGDRIGIIGGSYGGYMVLAALTLKPTEFAVGVDLYGISNWVRTLESIPPYWESFREALYKEIGDPKRDKDKLYAISPLFHADKIVRPLMVLQGANDPRVIKPESDSIVEAVRKRNGVVEYLVFDDEGHGISKKKNQAKAYAAVLGFLDKYLRK